VDADYHTHIQYYHNNNGAYFLGIWQSLTSHEIHRHHNDPEILLPRSQQASTVSYPEPAESIPPSDLISFKVFFLILSSYVGVGFQNDVLPIGISTKTL
jgi:hypothetical protein